MRWPLHKHFWLLLNWPTRLPRTYPRVQPILTIQEPGGLSSIQVSTLSNLIRTEAQNQLGNEMIFQVRTSFYHSRRGQLVPDRDLLPRMDFFQPHRVEGYTQHLVGYGNEQQSSGSSKSESTMRV